MKKSVEATIGKLTRLEDRGKPSIAKAIQSHSEQIALAKKEEPEAERPRPASAES